MSKKNKEKKILKITIDGICPWTGGGTVTVHARRLSDGRWALPYARYMRAMDKASCCCQPHQHNYVVSPLFKFIIDEKVYYYDLPNFIALTEDRSDEAAEPRVLTL